MSSLEAHQGVLRACTQIPKRLHARHQLNTDDAVDTTSYYPLQGLHRRHSGKLNDRAHVASRYARCNNNSSGPGGTKRLGNPSRTASLLVSPTTLSRKLPFPPLPCITSLGHEGNVACLHCRRLLLVTRTALIHACRRAHCMDIRLRSPGTTTRSCCVPR